MNEALGEGLRMREWLRLESFASVERAVQADRLTLVMDRPQNKCTGSNNGPTLPGFSKVGCIIHSSAIDW